jgi:hypothetical protein
MTIIHTLEIPKKKNLRMSLPETPSTIHASIIMLDEKDQKAISPQIN